MQEVGKSRRPATILLQSLHLQPWISILKHYAAIKSILALITRTEKRPVLYLHGKFTAALCKKVTLKRIIQSKPPTNKIYIRLTFCFSKLVVSFYCHSCLNLRSSCTHLVTRYCTIQSPHQTSHIPHTKPILSDVPSHLSSADVCQDMAITLTSRLILATTGPE